VQEAGIGGWDCSAGRRGAQEEVAKEVATVVFVSYRLRRGVILRLWIEETLDMNRMCLQRYNYMSLNDIEFDPCRGQGLRASQTSATALLHEWCSD